MVDGVKLIFKSQECSEMCEPDQNEYENNIADTSTTDALIKFCRWFIRSKTQKSMFFNDEYATSPETQTELFPEYFASIFISSRTMTILPWTALVDTIDDFDVSETTNSEICESSDIKEAKGPDGIPSIFYKNCAMTIAESLSQVFNRIKQTATFPNFGKQSQVSQNPVVQKRNKSDIET